MGPPFPPSPFNGRPNLLVSASAMRCVRGNREGLHGDTKSALRFQTAVLRRPLRPGVNSDCASLLWARGLVLVRIIGPSCAQEPQEVVGRPAAAPPLSVAVPVFLSRSLVIA